MGRLRSEVLVDPPCSAFVLLHEPRDLDPMLLPLFQGHGGWAIRITIGREVGHDQEVEIGVSGFSDG